MEDTKILNIKKKLDLFKKKSELKRKGFVDYSKILKDILDKLEQIEKKEIDFESMEDGLKIIAELLTKIKAKEIVIPEYPKVRTEEMVESVKKLQDSLEKKEKEKMAFWNKIIVLFKKPIDFKEIGRHLKELAGKILRVRIEEQGIILKVHPIDEKGNIIRAISTVVVQGLGILKNIAGQIINPATEEKQDDIISAIGTIGGGGATETGDGTETVITAGVPVQLPDQECRRVFIQAHESNAGTIVIGSSTVVAALVGRRGLALFATQGDWFNVANLNLLYIDSTQNGDKVNYYYEK